MIPKAFEHSGHTSNMNAMPFGLTDVRLLNGPFKAAMQRDEQYLLALDPDRLLHTFRITAGLPSSATPVGGWENPQCELRGHTLGHYLSACALMYASTGNEHFKTRVDGIVTELATCQDALPTQGYTPGFLSAYPESFFDRVERREPVWAPYYTLHKIMAGLLDAHVHCGNQQALEVLEKLAGWIAFRFSRLSYEQRQLMLDTEYGGMNELLANLYAVTGKPQHLDLARAFNHDLVLEPLARGEDKLDRLHANTQIPKVIGAAREYEVTGEAHFRKMATFFWERVALFRSYAIGGNSDHEHFFPIDRFDEHLSPVAAETCNTYNMLKLTRHLFAWEPSARFMDFYERALFNHILGSQDPSTGMMIYFGSLKPGHVKVYNTPEDSFWCCTGTGMENHAKYGDTIYFYADDELFVNLFIASELTWQEKALVLRQETRFPEQDTTRLTLHCGKPVTLALKIRYPAWAKGLSVTVNGRDVAVDCAPSSYITVKREWHDGDQIDVRLPMNLHLETLPGAANNVAVLYGPLVLAGALGTENLPDVYLNDMSTLTAPVNQWPVPEVPVLMGTPEEVLAKMEAVTGKALAFQTKGNGRPHDVVLMPFYQVHHQRYTVYWELRGDDEGTRMQF